MVNLEETKYHVDFGEYYVRMTDKQKRYLVVRSVIDRILAGIALTAVFDREHCAENQCTG